MQSLHADTLKKALLKCTPTRLAVLRAFDTVTKPVSAQDLRVRLKSDAIDLVTLYRTLDAFEKAGIINRVDLRKDAICYELTKHHHHHIVCTDCGVVEDVELCEVGKLVTKIVGKSKRFTSVRQHTFELFSVCTSCSSK